MQAVLSKSPNPLWAPSRRWSCPYCLCAPCSALSSLLRWALFPENPHPCFIVQLWVLVGRSPRFHPEARAAPQGPALFPPRWFSAAGEGGKPQKKDFSP